MINYSNVILVKKALFKNFYVSLTTTIIYFEMVLSLFNTYPVISDPLNRLSFNLDRPVRNLTITDKYVVHRNIS